MTNILELCQRIMQRHCQVADAAADLSALVAEQGQEINLLSTLVDTPAGNVARKALLAKAPYFLKYEMAPSMREWIEELVASLRAVVEGVHVPFAEWPRTASDEMAVHAPSTVPPDVAGAWANDTPAEVVSDDEIASAAGVSDSILRTSRSKSGMTAREWAMSNHFLAYIKTEPFSTWDVAKQNAMRNAFIAAMPTDEVLNRWGKRFAKFCGVGK